MALILLIEDDPTTRVLIASLLSPLGHTLIEAQDGRVGLQQLREMRPDLVITDIVMPEIEGLEVIRNIRRGNSEISILAISALVGTGSSTDYLEVAKALGASATLRKPFNPDTFIVEVDRLLPSAFPRRDKTQGTGYNASYRLHSLRFL